MGLSSIRWRLPLSYALIALISTAAVGLLLMLTLNRYYRAEERTHLYNVAGAIARLIPQMLAEDAPLQNVAAQVQSFAFLAQARVRLLDSQRAMLADSGVPDVVKLALDVADPQRLTLLREPLPPPERPLFAGEMADGPRLNPPPTPAQLALDLPPDRPANADVLVVPVVGTLFGFGLTPNSVTLAHRSDEQVELPIVDGEGRLRGYLVLSEGPAYGQEILGDVMWRLVMAGGAAIVLAAAAGWLISRGLTSPLVALTAVTARMAAGDLSARSEGASRSDEVGTLARSFNEMAARVEDLVGALRRFVADAAHELHTPLTALRTNLELAATASPNSFLRQAEEQIARLETVTQQLLDLSRLEATLLTGTKEPVALSGLVQEVCEFYASRAEQREIEFALADIPDGVAVPGSRSFLRQALENLLDNALKFTSSGGQVTVGVVEEGSTVLLWVEDSGIGIPAAEQALIFNRFYRGKNAVGYGGSGLGLALVQSIIQFHGGSIVVESQPGRTRITLKLPAPELPSSITGT